MTSVTVCRRSPEDTELDLAVLRFPLESYCRSLGARPSGTYEWLLTCPACRKAKLSVSARSRTWHCFVCERVVPEARGGIVRLIAWMEGKEMPSAVARVKELASTGSGGCAEIGEGQQDLRIPSDRHPSGLPEGAVPLTWIHPYMQRRGITQEDARMFGLHFVASGWLANRMVFPVWSQGRAVYWQARALWDEAEHRPRRPDDAFIKTLNPTMFQCAQHGRFPKGAVRCPACSKGPLYGKSDVLLNLELAAYCHRQFGERPVIVEGPTSAIRTGRNAIGTFGKVLHPAQLLGLLQAGIRSLDIMLDGPTAKEPHGAITEAKQMAAAAAAYIPDVRVVMLPQGDPGDWSRGDLERIRATPVSGMGQADDVLRIP
jgi:ribosomal protein S27E